MWVAVAVIVVVLVLAYRSLAPPDNLPPGLWGLPVIGVLLPKGVGIVDFFYTLRNKFGDIFKIRFGSRLVMVMSDYQIIRTALSHPSAQKRPDNYSLILFNEFENRGIVSSHGPMWQIGRRFAIRHLRDYGMGKSSMESIISNEVEVIIKDLQITSGKTIKVGEKLNVAVLNVLWKLLANRRFEIHDSEAQAFIRIIDSNLELIQGPVQILDFMPWLIPLIPKRLKDKWMHVNVMENNRDYMHEFLQNVVKEHQETLDPDHPRDYIDAYLIEAADHSSAISLIHRADKMDLISSLIDLSAAGSETTTSTLRWMVLFMAIHPHIQKKVQKEIDGLVPSGSLPSLELRDRLPYLEAAILEVQRKASLATLGLAHATSADMTLSGYNIPEGTVLIPFAESCHNDRRYFEKPEEFYPEHFLDEEGRVINKKDGFLPFSVGRRQCLGESLAKMELFLFTAALLQNFTISSPPGVDLTKHINKSQPFMNMTKPYSVVFTKRTPVQS